MEKMLALIDTHAHLDEIENLEQAIAQAKAAGVIAVIAVGQDLASNRKTLEIAARYPGFIYPALGYHPWNIKETEIAANLDFIRDNISKTVGIGEVGLDYHKRVRAVAEKDLQQRVLREI
jgi:TatD DNase family protein